MSGLLVISACCCFSLFILPGLATNYHASQNLERSKFLYVGVNAAMNQALDALNDIKLQQSKSRNVRETTALSDCMKFHELAIRQLNKTLDPNRKSITFLDTQMWLTAALTNLQNCKTTTNELNVTHSIFLSNNVSELISESLAINSQLSEKITHQEGFRSWFSYGDFSKFLRLSRNSAHFVVAQDGSGDFRTIKEALDAASFDRRSSTRLVIHIKQGIYQEYLEITSQMKNILLVGDGMKRTIITGNRSFAAGYTTFQSATVKVMGDGFVARDITFCNTAGAEGCQAVALYSSSDLSALYRCAFQGYQDTLWADSNRQFYQECYIYGTIDFIFGNAAVVFQNSSIYARKPMHGQSIVITAQGRINPYQPTGISIINCKVRADRGLKLVLRQYQAFLGRPWRKYSRTIYLKSFLDSLINPLGWMEWNGDKSTSGTVYYAEYANYGPGSSTRRRVKWPGYRKITNVTEAQKFSVAEFIDGQAWLPETGVPFSGGLSV